MQITIRPERPEEINTIHELYLSAFANDTEANLVDLLRRSDAFIPELSLVAEVSGNIAGHILFSKVTIEGNNGKSADSLALAPMAVSPRYQKKGIGSKMVHYGLQKAKELGYKSVIVVGHEHYYPRFGFAPAGQWHIGCPFDVPANVFMALELEKGSLANAAGVVKYDKAFYEV
jgi:putative acetyltransferase